MTSEELKKAFLDRVPVMCAGIEYKKISAIIYRHDRYGKVQVSAELLDRCGHSCVIVRAQDIETRS